MPDILLPVPYYSQRDSATAHSHRMCFSSSCAMLLNYLRPGLLKGTNGDDQYLNQVLKYGDTTSSDAQVRALNHFGLQSRFSANLNWADVENQLKKGIPVPIGILHHGPVSAPGGGGHWLLIIGRKADGSAYYVNDPYGDLDLVNGGYPGPTNGARLLYSKRNLEPRWRVKGAGGWGIIAKK